MTTILLFLYCLYAVGFALWVGKDATKGQRIVFGDVVAFVFFVLFAPIITLFILLFPDRDR